MATPSADDVKWFKEKFKPHFEEWVVKTLNGLVQDQPLVSFIFMACIFDYMSGFWWGESTQGKVSSVYKDFMSKYLDPKYDPDGLYDSLRNGLVHMFTIKGKKYGLIHEHPELHLKTSDDGQIVLNASNFRDDLLSAKDKYFEDVENDSELMRKFKMRYEREGFLGLIQININSAG